MCIICLNAPRRQEATQTIPSLFDYASFINGNDCHEEGNGENEIQENTGYGIQTEPINSWDRTDTAQSKCNASRHSSRCNRKPHFLNCILQSFHDTFLWIGSIELSRDDESVIQTYPYQNKRQHPMNTCDGYATNEHESKTSHQAKCCVANSSRAQRSSTENPVFATENSNGKDNHDCECGNEKRNVLGEASSKFVGKRSLIELFNHNCPIPVCFGHIKNVFHALFFIFLCLAQHIVVLWQAESHQIRFCGFQHVGLFIDNNFSKDFCSQDKGSVRINGRRQRFHEFVVCLNLRLKNLTRVVEESGDTRPGTRRFKVIAGVVRGWTNFIKSISLLQFFHHIERILNTL